MVQNIPDWLKNPTPISLQYSVKFVSKNNMNIKAIKDQILRGNNS